MCRTPRRCSRTSSWNFTRANALGSSIPANLSGYCFFMGPRGKTSRPFFFSGACLSAMLARLPSQGFPFMFTVYGDKGSGAFSAEAALAEAGAPYDFHLISLEKNEQKKPEFLAINPSGKMPAVKLPEGQIITESLAILLTIADHFPNAHLLPNQASVERARAYRWLAFMSAEIYPMVEISDYPERFAPDGDEAKALRRK